MINLQKVYKSFGEKKAIEDISFHVSKGEILVLLGTSGCGKTTTLKVINRLISPDKGKIEVAGKDISTQKPEILRRGIGYVVQQIGLFPHYTVKENIAVVPHLLKWNNNKVNRSIMEILEKVHLSDEFLYKYPHELSGGQQQRVGLARALITDPPVVLMDEPLGALDPITRSNIRKEFRNLDAMKGKTVVMVTHDVEEAFELGDTICLMDDGRIQQKGSPEALLFHPENDFVRLFFKNQRIQLQMKTIKLNQLDLAAYYVGAPNDIDYTFEGSTSMQEIFNTLPLTSAPTTIGITEQKQEKGLQKKVAISPHQLYTTFLNTISNKVS